MVKIVGNFYTKMIRTILKQRSEQGLPITSEFLSSVWPELIGEELAEVTRPLRYEPSGHLTIATPSKTWSLSLSSEKRRLSDLFSALLPEPVKKITFEATPQHFERPDVKSPKAAPLGSLPLAELQLLDDIEDDELRATLTRVRRLGRARSDDN